MRDGEPTRTHLSSHDNIAIDGASSVLLGDGILAQDEDTPLLSVLNVVVDHVMVPPTPLEPLEFEVTQKSRTSTDQHQDQIRVPVVRVFGPLIRRDTGTPVEPQQSACLHIHGVFPYILARPVVAGPDGSLHHASHLDDAERNLLTASGHVDWDCVKSVERIIPELQSTLESTIQASFMMGQNPGQAEKQQQQHSEQRSPRVIRRITVVVGRGFYTYCPGPPAPFLRVEYYDPKLRWKVKLMMERGLDLPLFFHPDPQQYNSNMTPPDDNHLGKDALSFHCYEAHIPYTMQFFKDWNLAGMSYIHIADGRFRHPLPKNVRHRSSANSDAGVPSEALFLEGNIEARYLWNSEQVQHVKMTWNHDHLVNSDQEHILGVLQQSSSETQSTSQDNQRHGNAAPCESDRISKLDQAESNSFWTRKQTSCDIEIDTTTAQILNVKNVMTSLPEAQDERQLIHWRAVPSLREIWRQERRRMAKLLKPQDDFLSHSSQTRQGEEPSKPAQTPPFTLNVKKGASTPGARMAAEGMKRLFRVSNGLEEEFRRAMIHIIQRHSNAVSHVDSVLRAKSSLGNGIHSHDEANTGTAMSPDCTHNVDTQMSQGPSTPSLDAALEALGALASQFNPSDDEGSIVNHSTQSQWVESQTQITSSSNHCGARETISHHSPVSIVLSQGCTTLDPIDFSQRVDRGDSVMDGEEFANIEELIDPATLTPYEDQDDGNEEGGLLDDEEAMSEQDFERTLTVLATQTLGGMERIPKINNLMENIVEGIEREVQSLDSCGSGNDSMDSDSDESTRTKGVFNSNSNQHDVATSATHEEHNQKDSSPMIDQSPPVQPNDRSNSQQNVLITCNSVFEKRDKAPSKALVAGIIRFHECQHHGLYPLEASNTTPPHWMAHSLLYDNMRRQIMLEGNLNDELATFNTDDALYLEPIARPPSKKKVQAWDRKKRKRNESDTTPQVKKTMMKNLKSADDESAKQTSFANYGLEIDSNSRQLVSESPSSNKLKRVGFVEDRTISFGMIQEVEEAEWDPSQPIPLSMSPSQHDLIGDGTGCSQHLLLNQGTTGSLQSWKETNVGNTDEEVTDPHVQPAVSCTKLSDYSSQSDSQISSRAIDGIGQQGGKIYVEGGGGLKARTRSSQPIPTNRTMDNSTSAAVPPCELTTPLTLMCIEIHVQCRTGRAGVNDSKEIAMKPNSDKDMVFAVVYVYGRDPGGGESIQILERGCLYVPNESEHVWKQDEAGGSQEFNAARRHAERMSSSMPTKSMGIKSPLTVEPVRDEKTLLLRLASIVQWKDPDMLLSWDTQGAGLGYLIERGAVLGSATSSKFESGSKDKKGIDMARLLGRIPRASKSEGVDVGSVEFPQNTKSITETKQGEKATLDHVDGRAKSVPEHRWKGSGLGAEWDDRVGAGAAAASIVGRLVYAGWKIIAEEVKHPNASYLQAMVSTVLNTRIPFHDDVQLTRWYGYDRGRDRWRVLHHHLTRALACVLMFDALDIVGRAGEAARLSGVEFSQSFPGIRGSQYKVEGVLLRALQSLHSDERGAKRGRQKTTLTGDERKSGIDHSSSFSCESHSQTQSPWKIRRQLGAVANEQESEHMPVHAMSDRCYFFFSPSLQDCNKQEALECQAMTLEPRSGCQRDPVVVCDFTALYPSLVIAYNLCYSTCAGKLDYHSTRQEMRQEGRTTGRLGPFLYPEGRTATVLKHHMKSLSDDDTKAGGEVQGKDRAYTVPTGAMFVSEAVLKGVLPQVLDEILSTRAMLKKAAKQYKKFVPGLSPSVLRQLEARQLALKYVANVTYGYTSATFSGRCAMPILADSIVECGRRTLSNAINLANQWGKARHGRWYGAEVIYGDTDSVFVKLPGRTVREAFEFGEAFCKAVTATNPPPVQLKLEKVYFGSMMQTKKRYCGMKYESIDQKKPSFEAKGIETIRRDQCALTQKVLRNALITLFRSGVEAVKAYLYRQWSLILAGRLPVSDFILTGKVRSQYRGGRVGPVQAVLARRLAEADPGRMVRHKERLAYVIVATPGLTFRLRDCVLTPTELLEQWDAYTIHSAYYITKHVNMALQRCLGLEPHKIDVNTWYEACPKPRRRVHFWPLTRSGSNLMISSYFGSDICSLCGRKCKAHGSARAVVCSPCQEDRVQASHLALTRLNTAQQEAQAIAKICSNCNGCFEDAGTFAVLKQSSSKESINRGTLLACLQSDPGIVTPIANCTCIDCPKTFERHRLRETELEAIAVCKALDLL